MDPSELDASVAARIPTRSNKDNRYFTDTYQAMPMNGYTKMFENMLSHPNISVMINTDYKDLEKWIPYKRNDLYRAQSIIFSIIVTDIFLTGPLNLNFKPLNRIFINQPEQSIIPMIRPTPALQNLNT